MAKRAKSARMQNAGPEAEIVLPDFLPALGDVIDGGEDDITELERGQPAPVASAVGSDDPSPAMAAAARAVKQAAAKKKKVELMADATKSEPTKAELIRSEIASRVAAGEEKIRPRDIVAALKAKGVTVHAPQVSVALRDATAAENAEPRRSKPKAEKAGKPAAADTKRSLSSVKSTPGARPAHVGGGPSYDALQAAAAFVTARGGLPAARDLLNAYEQLLNLPK